MAQFGPASGDPRARPFWEAAREHRLVLPFDAQGAPCWYPHGEVAWREVAGPATLVSFTVVRGPINPHFDAPYAPALVELDAVPGLRLVTRIVDCDFAALACGMRLELCYRELQPRQGAPFVAPLFRPLR